MAQKPVIVGDVYFIDGIARLKLSISLGGVPVTGQIPTVTIVRDRDNYALNFLMDSFEDFGTPTHLDESKYKATMIELGQGVYFWDFDPALYGETTEEIYTAIFRNETPGFEVTIHNEFTITNRFSTVKFGLVNRPLQVCLHEEITIAYKALSGQHDVNINIYNPSDELIVSNATMVELGTTGIYRYKHIFTLDGEHLVQVSESTNGSSDSMILVVGRMCDRIKRIEQQLGDLMQNPPTVNPC